MRINMQAALASLHGRHLATAANAAIRPTPSLPDSLSPSPEPPQPPEHESVIWLRAVVDGDKATAEKATPGDWESVVDDHGRGEVDASVWSGSIGYYIAEKVTSGARHQEDAAHIARQDPQHTIARCEAELKLLDLHGLNRYGYCLTCDPDSCGCVGSGDYPCATVCALLSGYRHRGGFKPEWVSA